MLSGKSIPNTLQSVTTDKNGRIVSTAIAKLQNQVTHMQVVFVTPEGEKYTTLITADTRPEEKNNG